MHDPEVQVFRLHVPIPEKSWRVTAGPRWSLTRRRYTAPERLGDPIYPLWRPHAFDVTAAGRHLSMITLAELWHHEPGDRDAGEVCGRLPSGSALTAKNVRWAWEHREHCHWRLRLGRKTRGWLLDRCEDCGRRFGWNESRMGIGWDAPGVLHSSCSTVRHMASQIGDLTAYASFSATDAQRWRVERMLDTADAAAGS